MFNIPTFVYLIFGFIAVALVLGWILVPFILMNTNAYLRRLLREQERTNELLDALRVPRQAGAGVPSVRVEPRDR